MQLIDKEHVDYHTMRKVWNGMIDKLPRFIAVCSCEQDVVDAIQLAREHSLAVSVRGGGHSICGHSASDDGLLIDLSGMRGVTVDVEQRTATVQGGALWGDVDAETCKHQLVVPGGMISHTGVGGLTLGGGIGWISRSYGLTCDNLISATVVTADGSIVTASPTENSDLLWGLQGGGGNFGVVTSFTFQLFTLTKLEHGTFYFPFHKAQKLLEFYFTLTSTDVPHPLPDCISVYLFVSTAYGVLVEVVFHEGDITADQDKEELTNCYRAVYHALIALRPSYCSTVERPYTDLQSNYDSGNSHGKNYYWKSLLFDKKLSSDAIKQLVTHVTNSPLTSSIEIMHLGGAISRKKHSDTAFFQRNAKYEIHCMSVWTESDIDLSIYRNWARDFSQILSPHSCNTSGYINTSTTDLHKVKEAYGDNFSRLVELKQRYDPDNFFHQNHNISPNVE